LPKAYASKKEVNWDRLEKEAEEAEKSEKVEGEAALMKLFRDIYANADEDTKRAMMKSYSESGGTSLSTNWNEVGKGEVKPVPPAGLEPKKL
jgi:suppressor of G2 allele of SKP1